MFRFTIRDLLWLTVAVGLTLGWYIHWRQMERRAESAVSDAWDTVNVVGEAAEHWSAEANRDIEIRLPKARITAHPKGKTEYDFSPHGMRVPAGVSSKR